MFLDNQWNGTIKYRRASTDSLTTTFQDNARFAGNMFDVLAKSDLKIQSLLCHIDGSSDVTVDIWYREGSYVGFENSPDGWVFAGSEKIAQTFILNKQVRISVPPIFLEADQTYGFYVNLASYEAGVEELLYTIGSNVYDSDHLRITTGVGKGEGAFTGSTFPDRTWNGALCYQVEGPRLWVTKPVAGATATVHVADCTPGGTVYVAYSLAGGAPTVTSCGSVYLSPPFETNAIPPIQVGNDGQGSISGPINLGVSGVPIWSQALDASTGQLTNPVATVHG